MKNNILPYYIREKYYKIFYNLKHYLLNNNQFSHWIKICYIYFLLLCPLSAFFFLFILKIYY